jgi:putative phosphoesterase
MEEPRTIGVIADTHDRLPARVLELLSGVDVILHAGDVCSRDILDQLAGLAPVAAARGNNDVDLPELPWEVRRTFRGVRFVMIHIPPGQAPPDCDWLIVGHTHRPQNEVVDGVRWFNPGSAGLANKGKPRSVAVLHWRNEAWEPTLHVLNS